MTRGINTHGSRSWIDGQSDDGRQRVTAEQAERIKQEAGFDGNLEQALKRMPRARSRAALEDYQAAGLGVASSFDFSGPAPARFFLSRFKPHPLRDVPPPPELEAARAANPMIQEARRDARLRAKEIPPSGVTREDAPPPVNKPTCRAAEGGGDVSAQGEEAAAGPAETDGGSSAGGQPSTEGTTE